MSFGKDYFEGKTSNYPFYENIKTFDSIAKVISIILRPNTVLDVGCAKGFIVSSLRNLGICAYGIDISNYAISQNKKHKKFLYKIDAGSDNFPFKNNFFDLVICFETIEHIKNHNHLLKECHRILKKGGHLIISTPKRKYSWDVDKTHINIHEPKFWKTVLIDNGYKIFRTYSGLHSLFLALFDGKTKSNDFFKFFESIQSLMKIVSTPLETDNSKLKNIQQMIKEIFITSSFLIQAQKI